MFYLHRGSLTKNTASSQDLVSVVGSAPAFPGVEAATESREFWLEKALKISLGFALAPGTVAFCRRLLSLPSVAGERFRSASRAL
jgi:hypothetical protein